MASTQTRPPAKVFVDASVLIATAISQTGRAHELILAGLTRSVHLVFSDDVFIETERNLATKYPSALPAFSLFREAFATNQVFPSTEEVRRAAEVVAVKDAPILAGAIEAQAAFLATYDRRHLIARKDEIFARFHLTVATPEEILHQSCTLLSNWS